MEAKTQSRLQSRGLDSCQFRWTLLFTPRGYFQEMCSARHAHSPPPLPGSSLSLEILSAPPPPKAVALAATLETASFKRISTPEEVEKQACSTSHFWAPNISPTPLKKDQTLLNNGRRRVGVGVGQGEDRRGSKERKEQIREPRLILIRLSLCLNYTFFSSMLRKPIHMGKQITCYLFTSLEFSLIDSKRI